MLRAPRGLVSTPGTSNSNSTEELCPTQPINRTDPVLNYDTPDTQDLLLFTELYSQHYFSIFPFIEIPHNTSPDALLQDRPLLSLVIALLACQTSSRQQKLTYRIKQYISDHVIMSHQTSLDFVQGLLLLAAW